MKLISMVLLPLLLAYHSIVVSQVKIPAPYQGPVIRFDSTTWTYEASLISNHTEKTLTFLKGNPLDTAGRVYSEVRFHIFPEGNGPLATQRIVLNKEIEALGRLWDTLATRIQIDLITANMEWSYIYHDVQKNYISLFAASAWWNNKMKEYPKRFSNAYVDTVLLTGRVYRPYDSLLRAKGYCITSYYTEKNGFVPKNDLVRKGYKPTLRIPMPGICLLGLERCKQPGSFKGVQ